jgi:hypothetical protein
MIKGDILYNLDINIFKSLKLVLPINKYFSVSSLSIVLFPGKSKGRFIRQFLIRDKWDFGLNKQFFSDSIIINLSIVIHL